MLNPRELSKHPIHYTSCRTLILTAACGPHVPTNKINIDHLYIKKQSSSTKNYFLGICKACLHNWSANQHCHTIQCELNLAKHVGNTCPRQWGLRLHTTTVFQNTLPKLFEAFFKIQRRAGRW